MSGAVNAHNDEPWQIWIDTGGTFTDCLARDPGGHERRAKVLSTSALRGQIATKISDSRMHVIQNWEAVDDLIKGCTFRRMDHPQPEARVIRFDASESILELDQPLVQRSGETTVFEVKSIEPAPILAARLVTGTAAGASLPPIAMRLATTRGTNALLERRGAPVALFITQGFGDLLVIGDQQRPDLFSLKIERPAPLYESVVEVRERIAADGSIITPLDVEACARDANSLLKRGVRVAAVSLMHSHVNPGHEQILARRLRGLGFEHVSVSSDLAPMIRLLPRAQTAVVDAYLAPVIHSYLSELDSHFRHAASSSRLHVMTSAGGLVAAERYRACDSLLSGPAGGVAGAAAAGRRSGFSRIIGFDMGGTSTDVARFDGDFEYRFEHKVADVRMLAPALAIETVAAGGGSICDFIGERLTVGPHSAGARPGPACYSSGGPLTITDVNLLLGRLDAAHFEIPIQRTPAEEALRALQRRVTSTPKPVDEQLLEGFLDIANERMAAAIEQISVQQGFDPAQHALVAFGGAGGQHACAVAQRLGIPTVLMPADASLLSALGLGQAAIERFAQRQVLRTLAECAGDLPKWLDELSIQARQHIEAEGVPRDRVHIRRVIANLRLLGQDATLSIELEAGLATRQSSIDASLRTGFQSRYREVFGHEAASEQEKPIEIESIRVIASSAIVQDQGIVSADRKTLRRQSDTKMVRGWFNGAWVDVPSYERASLALEQRICGPALVVDRRSTCVLEAGWEAHIDRSGALVALAHSSSGAGVAPRSRQRAHELVELELFSNRLTSIADEMGQMLQRTALSTNVKERLDFSCAILDSEGDLVVNAPHIPVHLGALGVCVRTVRDAIQMHDGDVIITNHPAFGGSHLPDVTVITPVFFNETLIGYAANRAHHAEIGGIRPGSMPPMATRLIDEGVVIAPRYLIHRGESKFDEIERLLRAPPHPSRAVRDNMADLRAAVAANQRGAASLRRVAEHLGAGPIANRMTAIKQRAERLTRDSLQHLSGKRMHAVERLDDGSAIHVTISVDHGAAIIDFAGSAPVHAGNLNATPAIVRSAVIYVLRLLVGEHLPLNEGIMRAVDVRIPRGMLNPDFDSDPAECPAVVGGNVETSQRIVDTLLKALKLCACSQGTMNNVLFGNDRFGYYETVCGGSGASPGFAGADAVHTHMTNTRITDPEIIEHRYPARVEQFSIRTGSGGPGTWRGGDGAIRKLQFLEPMSLSILSQHRTTGPYGMDGGGFGQQGRQRVVRANSDVVELKSIDGCDVGTGDRLILETPGGGGWGSQE